MDNTTNNESVPPVNNASEVINSTVVKENNSEPKEDNNNLENRNSADHNRAHAHYHGTRHHEPTFENWDEKPLPAHNHKQMGDAFVVPFDNDDVDGRNKARKTPPNTFAAKKTVAQGMMDIALLTANANQLRYLIEYNSNSSTFILNVILIAISILLQIAVGISLIFKGRFDMRGQSKCAHARRINNYVVVGVFLITIINVFVASFTINGNTSKSSSP